MMEKVLLTQEQAEAIERFLNEAEPSKEHLLKQHALGVWLDKRNAPMNALSIEEMAKALFVGYSIKPEEPKFKSGDKVISNRTGCLHTLGARRPDADD